MSARGPTKKPLTADDKDRMYDDDLMRYEGVEDDSATPTVDISDHPVLAPAMRAWIREQEAAYRWREKQAERIQQELGPDTDTTEPFEEE